MFSGRFLGINTPAAAGTHSSSHERDGGLFLYLALVRPEE